MDEKDGEESEEDDSENEYENVKVNGKYVCNRSHSFCWSTFVFSRSSDILLQPYSLSALSVHW